MNTPTYTYKRMHTNTYSNAYCLFIILYASCKYILYILWSYIWHTCWQSIFRRKLAEVWQWVKLMFNTKRYIFSQFLRNSVLTCLLFVIWDLNQQTKSEMFCLFVLGLLVFICVFVVCFVVVVVVVLVWVFLFVCCFFFWGGECLLVLCIVLCCSL